MGVLVKSALKYLSTPSVDNTWYAGEMRSIEICGDEYYHVFNRGMNKQRIFLDDRERSRFLFLLLFLQSSAPINNLGDYAARFSDLIRADDYLILENSELRALWDTMKSARCVELISFVLMGNHFHISARALRDNGLAVYLQRVQNGYTKYFNIKNDRSGHLFQGPYKVVHQPDDERLMMLTAYHHHNPNEILASREEVEEYKWSSYRDYLGTNRWGELLKPEIVLGQFNNSEEYRQFVNDGDVKSTLGVDNFF